MEVWIVTANGIGDFLNLFSEVFFFLFGYKDRNVLQICLHALHLLFLYTYSKALKLSIRISKYFILLLPRVCIFSLYGLTASISNLLYLYMYTEDYTTFYCTLSPIALSCFFFFWQPGTVHIMLVKLPCGTQFWQVLILAIFWGVFSTICKKAENGLMARNVTTG